MGSAPRGEADQQGTRSSIQCGSNAGALPERIETQGLALEEPLFAAWTLCNGLRLHGAAA
jgi:hypothetical protein